jgi:hypothetical protein
MKHFTVANIIIRCCGRGSWISGDALAAQFGFHDEPHVRRNPTFYEADVDPNTVRICH